MVEALLSANQDAEHAPFAGIVPEVAGRSHTLSLLPLLEKLMGQAVKDWNDVGAIAVTNRPGLIGSLIVGVVTAKSLAMAKNLPFIGVNHLEGHILAPFLRDQEYHPQAAFAFPFLSLAVSGGHSSIYFVKALGQYEILGSTLDDAAGECFDKFAKMLGLGFPGGVKVDELAGTGDPKAFHFPRSLMGEENLDMSFSGLKASAQRLLQQLDPDTIETKKSDLCASFQQAIVDTLMTKLAVAQRKTGLKNISVTGGVSANSGLRAAAQAWAVKNQLILQIPPIRYCTDNAAMIGLTGLWRINQLHEQSSLAMRPQPGSEPRDFTDRRKPR